MIEIIEEFEIEDLGIQEEWVYDIEVEDNHNFFGNNILVHNSAYYHIEPFMNAYIIKNPDQSMDDYVTVADNFEKTVIAPVIQKCIDDFSKELNAYNTEIIGAEREIIADCLLAKTMLTVKDNNNPDVYSNIKRLKISELARIHGINIINKTPEVVDLSHLNITVPSYDEEKCEYVQGKILNIQKKITSKRVLELYHENGTSISCTEDHKVSVNVDGGIIWKEVKSITEDDDVMVENFSLYSKRRCDLFDVEYINHGSKNSNRKEVAKAIKKPIMKDLQ